MKPTEDQQAAIDMIAGAAPPRVMCLTGGPGCGKTQTTLWICDALEAQGKRVALCAPSGKAAKRLAECSGRTASTAHRLLGLRPDVYQPTPILADVCIVDEASMVDIRLMASIMRGAFDGGGLVRTVLLVGDPDQLPPVGPGAPFLDLIAADTCATVRLDGNQRAEQWGAVDKAAHAIQAGDAPEYAADFRMVVVEESAAIAAAVWQLCEGREEDYQTLSPQRPGNGGTDELNAYMDRADVATLSDEAYTARQVRGLRTGSRVIHTKNNKELGVFNGETGTVTRVHRGQKADGKPSPRADQVRVLLDDGRDVLYTSACLSQLRLAWALTIHKSQGSEWPTVVVVCHTTHTYMLSRSLLYVAVTRARSRVYLVGVREAVARAVASTRDRARRTTLAHMLAEGAEFEAGARAHEAERLYSAEGTA